MHIYDSVQKKKLPFEPIKKGKVSIYVCGPTVYDDAHLGHARSALSFDLLTRTLKALNYKVTMGKNFTDIDDKIIKKVQESGKSLQEITQHYIARYLQEMDALGVQRSDIEPKATESMEAITQMIQSLIDKGFAYRISTGDVYFDTAKDAAYGNISYRVSDEESQSRVEHTSEKRNPKDFALWKACKSEDEICFETPFSSGRPGWHIECSAMIEKHFRGSDEYTIDIHGGGADLLFPHHENEAAQSRCATGHELSKYWMHNGFVQINGEKMSKSLGNSFFLKDALKEYDGEVLRFYLLSTHYRSNFNFNSEDLSIAKKRLDKIYRLKKRVFGLADNNEATPFKTALLETLSDDMNVSSALALIEDMLSSANETLDTAGKHKQLKKEIISNLLFIENILGFGVKNSFEYFQFGIDEGTKDNINALIVKRNEAKKAKDFETSDTLRDKILSLGVNLMDTPQGTFWEKV